MAATPHSTPRSRRSHAGSATGGCDAAGKMPEKTEAKAPRAVAYIRESTEEQGQGFSPDAQREQIRKFAAENGLELGEEYSDFHSGWRKADARPQFQRLMSDAAEQRFDVVLVYHTSRFARNQAESRRYKQLLRERLGIRVVSVTQPMGEDPTDPSAFLAESIHEMFDEYYSVSLSFWTAPGCVRRPARATCSASSPGATCATPTPGSPLPSRSGRRWCASCLSPTRPGRSQTARWPPGSTRRARVRVAGGRSERTPCATCS